MIKIKHVIFLVIIKTFVLVSTTNYALSEVKKIKGQTVYVPIYSHIYHGDQEKYPFYLTATLSIRNTDLDYSIIVKELKYYDSNGKLVRDFGQKDLKINPMSSTRVIIKESDISGGSGASFIVKWHSENNNKVSEPIIEAIMIGTKVQQGISFTSRGKAVQEFE